MKMKAVKTETSSYNDAYKIAKNKINTLIQNTEAKYFQQVIRDTKNNSKVLWRSTNNV